MAALEDSRRGKTICPSCGERLPEDTIWLHQNKFYCSEKCAAIGRIK